MSDQNPPEASSRPDNWKVEIDANNIAWLHFDMPGASANLLSQSAIEQLDNIIQ
ncbi:MAG: hypothetical protein HKP22_10990, partial [Gammaproteobacteria bacterium]|nr:hypothetical protein [Gammaproteobacteria bacterium]